MDPLTFSNIGRSKSGHIMYASLIFNKIGTNESNGWIFEIDELR